jgi:hypothetical protein
MSIKLQRPVCLQVLGDEVRDLEKYLGLGVLTQEEAQERVAKWELFYPPGWHRIVELVASRRHQPLPKHERNVQPWDLPDAAE